MRRWVDARPTERVFSWLTLALLIIALEVVAAHVVTGVLYPHSRTALYVTEIWTLAAVLAVDVLGPSLLGRLAWVVIAVVLADDVAAFQLHRSADVAYDAAGRDIIAMIEADHAGSSRHVRLGGSWQVEPSMNFYRLSRGLDWMAVVDRDPVPSPGYDYYVIIGDDADFVRRLGLEVRYVAPDVGTILAVPAQRHQ
jgi:hypothetical protein